MDPIKEAFSKIKQEITDLRTSIISLQNDIEEIKRTISSPAHNLKYTSNTSQQTDRPTDSPAHNSSLYGLKDQNMNLSIGNGGVPTDRQTDQQTVNRSLKFAQSNKNDALSELEKVSEILASLDNIKKGVRTQFKRLTGQEMLVFSTLYELEDSGFTVDYPLLAQKLNLTESSIRDYIQRMIKKDIPISKVKENNKKVILKISTDLKQIASLSTIQKLRDL